MQQESCKINQILNYILIQAIVKRITVTKTNGFLAKYKNIFFLSSPTISKGQQQYINLEFNTNVKFNGAVYRSKIFKI